MQELVTRVLDKRAEVPIDRSMLMVVSGIDSSGKGHITNMLVAELNSHGIQVVSINIDPCVR